MGEGRGVFIGPKSSGRSVKGPYICVLLHSGPKAALYV
jgi:hypothetical protein